MNETVNGNVELSILKENKMHLVRKDACQLKK